MMLKERLKERRFWFYAILVVAILINIVTLWRGRGFQDGGLALFQPIKQSEVTAMYQRTHPIKYWFYTITTEDDTSRSEHWADKYVDFWESNTNISITNLDAEATEEMLQYLDLKENLRINWVAQQMEQKSIFGFVLWFISLFMLLLLNVDTKIITLVQIAIAIAFGTISPLNTIALICIYLLSFKKIDEIKSKGLIVLMTGSIFATGIAFYWMLQKPIALQAPINIITCCMGLLGISFSFWLIVYVINPESRKNKIIN